MADVNQMRQQFFQKQRDDIDRQARGQHQEVGDALNRRFTALGQSGSGAAMNAQLKAREAVESQANQVRGQLAGQELQAQIADQESEKQRQFASQQADKDYAFKRNLFDVEQGNKLKELDLAERQFLLDKETTEFNKMMAEMEGRRENGGLLGQGGFLGTGLGKGNIAGDVKKGVETVVSGGINLIGGGGGCYLTTATVEAMGLADDCWVLESARKFRDTYMAQNSERAGQIRDYYEYAPRVVEQINASPEAKRVWKSFFWKDIIPFVTEVEKGENAKAHVLYLSLVNKAKTLAGLEV